METTARVARMVARGALRGLGAVLGYLWSG